ncbi:DUF3500 domain-containing protein [Cellulomonas sp. JZ18]|uniref:DUF3500 domain-containing protein n=1 Tax=Cellulomonas sp. JZ18 TaxID=2654191 RepID=UPI0012D3EE4B|nr:DUF3500 domain-containing protein [Cellulomonas sp. JZ18]QGQ18953.1 DUF3500 domain-containing protein [Cellulomonas sp. JZ18]
MTTNTEPTQRPRRTTRALAGATSLLLLGGLLLSGCATETAASSTSTSSTTTSATTASGSSSGSTVAAAARQVTSSTASTTAETITNTSAAVEAFLATLSDEQVEAVTYDYDDPTKSTSWSNFPVTFVDRAGLNVADLTEEQQVAALQVLEALLSDEGYATVSNIIAGDQYLADASSSTEDSLGQYYLAVFGDASSGSAYEVQFGGHHLGINATLDAGADAITFAPTHLGTQPEVWTSADGTQVETFGTMYTTAFAFYDSLTDEQKAALYQGEDVQAMVCAPGSTCTYPTGTGLAGSSLTDEQKQLLLDVVANWVGLADEQTTAAALAEIEATLDQTYVSWSGATVYDMTQGDGISFQISGPDVYIEFASQQGSAGADVEGVVTSGWGHVHTIYRDPGNDYANSVEQQEATGGMGGGAPAGGGPAGGGTPPAGGPGGTPPGPGADLPATEG